MAEHLSDEDITSYRQCTMPPAQFIAANDHLAECAQCFSRFYDPTHVQTVYELVRASLEDGLDEPVEHLFDEHLFYEDLYAYVDDNLDDDKRPEVEAHLQICEECKEDVAYLLNIKFRIEQEQHNLEAEAKTEKKDNRVTSAP